MRPRRVLLIALAVIAGQAFGAELPPEKPPEAAQAVTEKKQPAESLPAPLEGIATNLADLEKSGDFTIERAEFAVPDESDEEAFVWTIKVNRSLTIRHAMLLLDRFRDVRFYNTEGAMPNELHSTWLHYSPRMAERAINRDMLKQDETFQAWVVVSPTTVRMLNSMKADTVLFQPPGRRTPAKPQGSPRGEPKTETKSSTNPPPKAPAAKSSK